MYLKLGILAILLACAMVFAGRFFFSSLKSTTASDNMDVSSALESMSKSNSKLADQRDAFERRVQELENELLRLHEKARIETPVDARTSQGDDAEVKHLTTELFRMRGQAAEDAKTISKLLRENGRLQRELATLKGENLVEKFRDSWEAKALLDNERTAIEDYVIRQAGVIPRPDQVKPLAETALAFDKKKAEWQEKWASDPDGPRGDFNHPKAAALLEERDQFFSDYYNKLKEILWDNPEALEKLLPKEQ